MHTLRLLFTLGVCLVPFFNLNAGNPRFDLTLGAGPALHVEKVNPELEYEEFNENLGVSYQVGGDIVIDAAEELKFHIGMSINYSKVSKTLRTR